MTKKYSIIIPVKNGIKYLPSCINTIIDQEYANYELIISNDHSTDGTDEYLNSLKTHVNIKIIEPTETLSMTEHWEWALSHASGEWLIFVGQDDGLQNYFFDLADILTKFADKNKIRTIMSSRAYYFWKGCEYAYGDVALKYQALNKFQILDIKTETLKALFGFQDYFELPQMYTTSMFKNDLLQEAKVKQNGKVFSTHPQDANLAAIAYSLEDKYLKSFIPLGWVGTSPKSAGMAIVADEDKVAKEDKEDIKELKKDYQQKVKDSSLKYDYLAGDFSLGSLEVYFWQALLKTNQLREDKSNKLLVSKKFRFLLFSATLNRIKKLNKRDNIKMMEDLIKINKLNLSTVKFTSYIFKLLVFCFNVYKYIIKLGRKMAYKQVYRYVSQQNNHQDTLLQTSKEISMKIKENILLNYRLDT